MLPTEILKPIDEIKTASNRVLVIILLIAVSTLFTIFYRSTQGDIKRLEMAVARQQVVIDSLRNAALFKSEDDNLRLKSRIAWQDSVSTILRYKINNAK